MRKLIALIAMVAVGGMAAVAYAQQQQVNTYDIEGKFRPNKGKASPRNPMPVNLTIGWDVGEESGLRPAVVETYKIGIQGSRINGRLFPKCTAEEINEAGTDEVCSKRALVGEGTIKNEVGADNDLSDKSIKCDAEVRIYNGGDHAALFIDGRPPDCAVSLATAIKADYVKMDEWRRGMGFEFTVPENLRHPIPGVSLAVKEVDVKFDRKRTRHRGEVRGFFEAIRNCPRDREIEIKGIFTPEQGEPVTATSTMRCRR